MGSVRKTLAFLLIGLFVAAAQPAWAAETYRFVTKWGSFGQGDGQFAFPWRVAVDGAGHVYVADTTNHRIQKFDSSGVFLTKWGSYGSGEGQFDSPTGVAVDGSGYVYVADTGNHRIQKFNSSGVPLAQWGSRGPGDGQFNGPAGVAVDGSGRVYVADLDNDRIQKFDSSGAFLTKWGSLGSGDGQFNVPNGVAVDGSSYVYVADHMNHRIQKFEAIGISGTVSIADAGVSGAPVVLRHKVTGAKKTTTTDGTGNYEFGSLAPGAYKIQIKNLGVRGTMTVCGQLVVRGVFSLGTKVKLQNRDTGQTLSTKTGAHGGFCFAGVGPATFWIIFPEVTEP
jgi:streptogramin lyase